jgi:hypothetical protein
MRSSPLLKTHTLQIQPGPPRLSIFPIVESEPETDEAICLCLLAQKLFERLRQKLSFTLLPLWYSEGTVSGNAILDTIDSLTCLIVPLGMQEQKRLDAKTILQRLGVAPTALYGELETFARPRTSLADTLSHRQDWAKIAADALPETVVITCPGWDERVTLWSHLSGTCLFLLRAPRKQALVGIPPEQLLPLQQALQHLKSDDDLPEKGLNLYLNYLVLNLQATIKRFTIWQSEFLP